MNGWGEVSNVYVVILRVGFGRRFLLVCPGDEGKWFKTVV